MGCWICQSFGFSKGHLVLCTASWWPDPKDRESGTHPQAALNQHKPWEVSAAKEQGPFEMENMSFVPKHIYAGIVSFKLSLEHVTHSFAYLRWPLDF